MRKNAKFYRNALCGLFAAFALGGFQVAHAAYANATPPPNFKAATSTAQASYAAAATDRTLQNFIRQVGGATITAGGQTVKMTVGYKLGRAAGRVAAAVVYAHPGIRTAASIAAWIGLTAMVYDVSTGEWKTVDSSSAQRSNGYEYFYVDRWYPILEAACSAAFAAGSSSLSGKEYMGDTKCVDGSPAQVSWKLYNQYGYIRGGGASLLRRPSSCPAGWYVTTAGCTQTPPMRAVPEEQFIDDLSSKPMPPGVPKELPSPTHLPVESPSPILNPTEGDNPTPSPMRVPTGDPIPIPNTNPQQYRQPYVDIVPSPTVDNPWRVDVKPGETTSTNPNPVENPTPDGEDKPAEEQEKSLCEKHPDILACSKPELDIPDGEIPRTAKQISYAEEGGFGGGSCPANVYANLHGKQTMVYEWARTCSVVSTYIRPIIILLGAMGALFILIPGRDS